MAIGRDADKRRKRGAHAVGSATGRQNGRTQDEEDRRILTGRVSRRDVLKGGAAIAGTTAVTGFPTVWAQNIKDVTLNHTGMSYSTLADIAQAGQPRISASRSRCRWSIIPGLLNRIVNDPKSIDVADIEIWQTKVLMPQGVTQARRDRQDQGLGQADARSIRRARSTARRCRARATRRSRSCTATRSSQDVRRRARPSG